MFLLTFPFIEQAISHVIWVAAGPSEAKSQNCLLFADEYSHVQQPTTEGVPLLAFAYDGVPIARAELPRLARAILADFPAAAADPTARWAQFRGRA